MGFLVGNERTVPALVEAKRLSILGHSMLQSALMLAHEREQSFIDDDVMASAIDQRAITPPTTEPPAIAAVPTAKPRSQSGTRLRTAVMYRSPR